MFVVYYFEAILVFIPSVFHCFDLTCFSNCSLMILHFIICQTEFHYDFACYYDFDGFELSCLDDWVTLSWLPTSTLRAVIVLNCSDDWVTLSWLLTNTLRALIVFLFRYPL